MLLMRTSASSDSPDPNAVNVQLQFTQSIFIYFRYPGVTSAAFDAFGKRFSLRRDWDYLASRQPGHEMPRCPRAAISQCAESLDSQTKSPPAARVLSPEMISSDV